MRRADRRDCVEEECHIATPAEEPELTPEHPLDRALRGLGEESHREACLELVWAYYEAATSSMLMRPPTEAQRRAVQLWLRTPDAAGSSPFFMSRTLRLTTMLHASVAEKASRLTQLSCSHCTPDPKTPGPLSLFFPDDREPWTAQSRRDKVDIRKSVTAALLAKGTEVMPWRDAPLCVSITALVPRPSRIHPRKDVDNLTKGLLDAMQGYLFPDDGVVQHLSARRLEYAGSVGCFFVSARPVVAPDVDVIYDDPTPPTLLSGHVPHLGD